MNKKNINFKIFKAYDIRGIYPSELNREAVFAIGRAFARKTRAKQVVVGRDMRLSGSILKKYLIQGLAQEGVREIIDIGLVPIDAVYFSVGILKYEAGIVITASHNPKEYNGLKMVRRSVDDMDWVRGNDLARIVQKVNTGGKNVGNGEIKIIKKNIYPEYIRHVLSFVNVKNIKPLKVVIDAGNGMAGKVMPILEKYLPIKTIHLNYRLDGNFPAHPSNPLLPESQVQISKKIKETKADCGVIFDGDTDRLFFVDEDGKFIRADITLLLLAKLFLEREAGAGIAYNLICSKIVPKMIEQWGGRAIRTAVGFVNVAQGMKKNKGIMGGEVSAHYSFRDNTYADSGFIALVILLELLSEIDKPLSQIVKPFYAYHKLPEINTLVEDIDEKIEEIKNKYKRCSQDYLDGVTVDNWEKRGWWFNVRPSNTEPLLRLTIEAKDKKMTMKLKKDLVKLIKK
ncbi:phosphomannomutase/phosphoglucomutase [Candidatus Kuenenbacteria bacterium CG11_big_fil_rev_8_21_14_0_20_37_9]|uniref:Phosphomannomutase/phosphoglucomutase n=2 Tax=Candidatus Kueneniibacteriota TaxID=1752740 RepID=A0A2M6XRV2_9BACT|nr:MAG: hypothetical protein AUJ29_00685 [Candidatus Kuenenbacteria bacterium CG1_02_38_13]PIR05867.1 MAG: phosphomannomutase/phosphoglucomutase [Candidatus Kuenenbacteria bacterium CG11_big_fil_rev_8_21_14_0_20_37_9]PIU10356.1 MAG: phosphomannomutase/phosphoglucomutase [Candidatus Kuenenbacteria bacterium CG08_land_8_20_14_0_20_37_23]